MNLGSCGMALRSENTTPKKRRQLPTTKIAKQKKMK
jgi:hypothetical protein